MAIETKEQLQEALADLDEASADEIEDILESIEEAQTALQTAGSEYDSEIEQAEQEATAALEQYNQNVTAAGTAKDAAIAAAEAAEAVDASDEIAAVVSITAPTVASNDVADIQAAVDELTATINAQIANIKTALEALNNPDAVANLKEAAEQLGTFAEKTMAATMPPATDTQPEIDTVFAQIDGMVP